MLSQNRCHLCGAVLPTDELMYRHLTITHRHDLAEIESQVEAHQKDSQ